MNKFTKGFLVGTAVTISALAGAVLGVKKTVIDPIEEKELIAEDNRKKAMRKSRAR
ncbi:DUF3042 family protein [Vagococcus jeotgali]|uniref:DUF3042 family protein n=1 Tax=Vagococcus jeotgali TaxID=3109030 RepID=UPI002DDAE127|nr:DUF3042 family protein [Vagococcus sp. B2T-5]